MRFGRKLADSNNVATSTQSATGSCQRLATRFNGDHNGATYLGRENTQSWLRNSCVSLTVCKGECCQTVLYLRVSAKQLGVAMKGSAHRVGIQLKICNLRAIERTASHKSTGDTDCNRTSGCCTVQPNNPPHPDRGTELVGSRAVSVLSSRGTS